MRTEDLYLASFRLAFLALILSITGFSVQRSNNQDHRGLKLQTDRSVNKLPVSSKRWALVVGVDQYDDKRVGQLNGATNDARALANVLEKTAGFPSDQIVLLTSDQADDRRATRANILRELSDLSSVVPEDGLLFISFSGHGIERNQQLFLLPSDAQVKNVKLLEQTSIPAGVIADWFRMKVKQVLVIIDACRSNPSTSMGGVTGGFMPGKTGAFRAVAGSYFTGLSHFIASLRKSAIDERNKGVVAFAVLYATESGHSAYEDSKNQQGYLTSAVVQALDGEAANTEGDVTLAALLRYVQDRVPKFATKQGGSEQRPFYSMEGYKAEDLVLAIIKR